MEKMTSFSSPKNKAGVFTTELLSRQWISERVCELVFVRPQQFRFKPGQRIRFMYEGLERDYSLTSIPGESTLSLCVRYIETGKMSSILANAKIGQRFHFSGPHGYFIFRLSPRPAVMVATGTGIAPFVSMGRSKAGEFSLVHGVKTSAELYYESFFRKIVKQYVPCVSRVSAMNKEPHDLFYGSVTQYLQRQLPLKIYDFYLCGRSEMIRDVTMLIDELFKGSLVYTEVFY